jgi:hypothetical protein
MGALLLGSEDGSVLILSADSRVDIPHALKRGDFSVGGSMFGYADSTEATCGFVRISSE